MRLLMIATMFGAAMAGTNAFAQGGSHTHHNFCLLTGSSKECAYDTMAQCEAAKHGNRDSCQPNSGPQNH